jgi:integrase
MFSRTQPSHLPARIPTRKGAKKAQPVSLTPEQAARLKAQPDTPLGRRDALLLCLLLDHGLRVGEVAGLAVRDFDLAAGELRFYRPKVDKIQTHRLTADTLAAARAYMVGAGDAPAQGPVLRASRKGGALQDAGMTARALTARVHDLGTAVGLVGLSAHDLRHYWATRAARSGTPLDRLQDAGGWASPAMPLRYVERAKIANQGVLLGERG